jgi:hypothetical protein
VCGCDLLKRQNDARTGVGGETGLWLGAAGTELILFDADGRAGILRTGDAAYGDEFEKAIAIQFSGPIDGNLHTFSKTQALSGFEEHTTTRNIEGFSDTVFRGQSLVVENPVLYFLLDREALGRPAVHRRIEP